MEPGCAVHLKSTAPRMRREGSRVAMPKRKTLLEGHIPSADDAAACSTTTTTPAGCFDQRKRFRTDHGFQKLVRRTIFLGDTTVPMPFDVFVAAVRHAEQQAHLEGLQKARSSASKDLRRAKAGYKRARGAVLGATVVKAELSPVPESPLPAVGLLKADDAKEKTYVARVAATEARAAFEGANGARAEAELAVSATQAEKVVFAAGRQYEATIKDSDKAAAKVGLENLRRLTYTEMELGNRVATAAEFREQLQERVHFALAGDPNFHELLFHSVHRPDLLELHEGYLTELTPTDVACVRAKGKVAADAMWAATASAIDEAKQKMNPGGARVYVATLAEVEALAVSEELVVRGTVLLEALRRRRRAWKRASKAFSLAAEKASRDLDEAMAGLDGTCSIAMHYYSVAGARVVEAESAKRRAGSEYLDYCNQLRGSTRRGKGQEKGRGG